MTFRGLPAEIAALKIGDTLYNFDGNRRVYTDRHSAPIYEKHFAPYQIVGETKVSWLLGSNEVRVNKKTLDCACHFGDRGYFTKYGMEADIWLNMHRQKIAREVGSAGVEQLKEIARIVGYRAA